MARPRHEALTVSRLIHEVLVGQLSIPFRQIVNDATFADYTGAKRPDLLISEFEFDGSNDTQFIENLVAYAEVKDSSCSFNDADWQDAVRHGELKSAKLKLPYFIVTNCRMSVFYNATTLAEITLNRNSIREFQTIDILRLIKNRLSKNPATYNIQTNVDSISTISEAIFNKKLWELATVYRGINFKDNQQKIDFTIGFVALEFYEEKVTIENAKDSLNIYWSECADEYDEKLVANIFAYVGRISAETDFKDFKDLIGTLGQAISSPSPLVTKEDVRRIYDIINSMRPLHGAGFDLFGAVYEMFASSKEKKDFGEYFTRRHYAHLLAKLLLDNERYWNPDREFTVLDPACGTGGFLTEGYKVLENYYQHFSPGDGEEVRSFLESRCFYGIDVRDENTSRTRLNMFLVGDGHTNIKRENALQAENHPFSVPTFDYVITNPPYGVGTIRADTPVLSTVRTEIAFLCRVRQLLKVGGRACVIQPDGVLENPSFAPVRREFLETCDVTAIISLPKFAFAPYTKEKTYAIFFTKRDGPIRIQKSPVWMYIIDNDGLANSDRRFPTKLRNNRNGWVHDEISGWVTTDGEEMPGILESRWLQFDDADPGWTEWIDEKGASIKLRKGGHVPIDAVLSDKYLSLLPEYYLRTQLHNTDAPVYEYQEYQGLDIPVSELFEIQGGNSGLTQEYLYSLLFHTEPRRYRLLTGSADLATTSFIYRCQDPKNADRRIRVVSDEGIHIVRKGKAGHINYLPMGDYTMTDDAYILVRKNQDRYKVSLKWVAASQGQLFREYASNSDNGTWHKGGFLRHATISLPSYEDQVKVLQTKSAN